ncbi:MAG: Ig-like domain-containing protein [Pirellulales bacterium]
MRRQSALRGPYRPRLNRLEPLERRDLLTASFLPGQVVGTVESTAVIEASGVGASRENDGVLWAHNDSGDAARLFAMDGQGRHRGVYNVSGASAVDWEDIAIGPGPQSGVDYLYIADMGDNARTRSSITVYRVPEPNVDASQTPVTQSVAGAQRIQLVYPDGPRDAETLLVDPVDGDLYIISKSDALSRIYRASYPQSTTQLTTLEFMGQMDFGGAVGGDISPTGLEILVKDYQSIKLYERPAGTNLWEALTAVGQAVPYTVETKGEAVTFDQQGRGYFTVGEGLQQPLYYYGRVGDPAAAIDFAVIGDFGFDGPNEASVAALVRSWSPDFVTTVGDNNYDVGSAATIDANIGKHYHEFIGDYQGAFLPGAATNRFFPALGNHDWAAPGAEPYLNYFTLPGNERYYDYVVGPVHFFVVDSDLNEPDGQSSTSLQAQWLQLELSRSTSPFQVVSMHHAPFSSSQHGSDASVQWPFAAWGADAVLAGHDHSYERLSVDGIPYFVNGLGGRSIYAFDAPVPGSVVRYNANYGAMRVNADDDSMTFQFFAIDNPMPIDSFTIQSRRTLTDTLVPAGSPWKYLDNGSNQAAAWVAASFDDSAWAFGNAELGYGDGDEATVVGFGPSATNKFVTTYFRREFTAQNASQYTDLTLRLKRDDGAVVYLNGQQVARSNMPAGSITYTTLASVAVGGGDETVFYTLPIDRTKLQDGRNVLAVEVHQSAVNSSDISFDLELTAIRPVPSDPPVAMADSFTGSEDTALNVEAGQGVLINDTDFTGNPLAAVLVTQASFGTVVLNSDGSFTYAPDAQFYGTDRFTYRATNGSSDSNVAEVTFDVLAVNDAPLATDDAYSLGQDSTLEVAPSGLLGNDTDVDGPSLISLVVDPPASGIVDLRVDGSFTYTPAAGYIGTDSFTYRATDGAAESNLATVMLTVCGENRAPIATDDNYAVDEDTTLVVGLAGILTNDNDADGDLLSTLLVDAPQHGALTLSSDGTFTYRPDANFAGGDQFTYRASDGVSASNLATVLVTVSAQNDVPVASGSSFSVNEDENYVGALLATDVENEPLTYSVATGPSHGNLLLEADGSFTYTPAADYTGDDGFTFVANDGDGSSTPASVAVTVLPVNDAPVASQDSYQLQQDQTLSITAPGVLANDADQEGNNLNAVLKSGPNSGSLTLAANGSFTYVPNLGFFGQDSFLYAAGDGSAESPATFVRLEVSELPKPIVYLSVLNNGPVGSITAANEDIIGFNGTEFSLFFDGSDVGLASMVLDAFSIVSATEVLLSFASSGTIPGLSGTTDDSDVVRFVGTSFGQATSGSFFMYFDGSDVGLTSDGEDIDAIELLGDGSLLVSTTDSASVPGVSAADEDIMRFMPTSLGATTAGTWSMYFDGSDVGLTSSNEDVGGFALDASGAIYLSTTGNFSAPGVSGANEDIFVFRPTSTGTNTLGTFDSRLFFDGSLYGLAGNTLTGFDLPVATTPNTLQASAVDAALLDLDELV